MNFILIILTGTLMGAFNFGFFLLGYYLHKEEKEGITVTKENEDFVKDLLKWRNY